MICFRIVVYDVSSIVSKNRNVSDGKLLPKCDNNVSKSGFVRRPCYGTCKIVQWATLMLMPKNFKMLSTSVSVIILRAICALKAWKLTTHKVQGLWLKGLKAQGQPSYCQLNQKGSSNQHTLLVNFWDFCTFETLIWLDSVESILYSAHKRNKLDQRLWSCVAR